MLAILKYTIPRYYILYILRPRANVFYIFLVITYYYYVLFINTMYFCDEIEKNIFIHTECFDNINNF